MRVVAVLVLLGAFGAPAMAENDLVAPISAGDESLVERQCDTPPELAPMRCYWLEVPERRDVPGARTLRLWVAVLGTSDSASPPVVDIYGGPGVAASASWVHGDLQIPADPGPRAHHDRRAWASGAASHDCRVPSTPASCRRRRRGRTGSPSSGCYRHRAVST